MRRRKVKAEVPPDDLPAVLLALARRGWTVDDLAARTGSEATLIKRWLRGEIAISQALRERVAAALAESADE